MREPSLQKTAAFSAALHLTVFIVTFIILRHSASHSLPSPYMVSLVGPGRDRGGSSAPVSRPAEPRHESAAQESVRQPETTFDQKRVEERISELKAKQKIEQIAKLRSAVLSVRGRTGPANSQQQKGPATGLPGGTGTDSYIAKITEEIHEQWQWPTSGGKDLETVISVTVMKDGTIKILGVEKRSGNSFFDRVALNALRKASPVSPPPQEMEIGIRFYP